MAYFIILSAGFDKRVNTPSCGYGLSLHTMYHQTAHSGGLILESGTVSDMCQKLFKIYISKCNVLIFGILFYFDIDILCFFRF